MLILDCPIIAVNIRKYLVTAPGETHTAWKPLALEECQNVKLLHLYNCQQGVNQLSTRCKICNHLSMKNMRVINFMNWWFSFMNWWIDEKWESLDNWQSLRPITLWGRVKKSELINYKGWQWVQRDLIQTTFSSEWRGGTVPETRPVSFVLWPGSAPSHKLCEQGHSLDGKLGHILARISLECTLHAFANRICLQFVYQ